MHKQLFIAWGIIAMLEIILASEAASDGNTILFIVWLIAACAAAYVSGSNFAMLEGDRSNEFTKERGGQVEPDVAVQPRIRPAKKPPTETK